MPMPCTKPYNVHSLFCLFFIIEIQLLKTWAWSYKQDAVELENKKERFVRFLALSGKNSLESGVYKQVQDSFHVPSLISITWVSNEGDVLEV